MSDFVRQRRNGPKRAPSHTGSPFNHRIRIAAKALALSFHPRISSASWSAHSTPLDIRQLSDPVQLPPDEDEYLEFLQIKGMEHECAAF